jgi:hypothetical protein
LRLRKEYRRARGIQEDRGGRWESVMENDELGPRRNCTWRLEQL